MFSSRKHLSKRTPSAGIDRCEFIEHLVEEYYTTTNIEAQEQVTANLANFAYDPINWQPLNDKQAILVFVEVISTPNERLQLHGIAGLCNICYYAPAYALITETKNYSTILHLFRTAASKKLNEILLNILTLFYQLANASRFCDVDTAIPNIFNESLLKDINDLQANTQDQRIRNHCTLLLANAHERNKKA